MSDNGAPTIRESQAPLSPVRSRGPGAPERDTDMMENWEPHRRNLTLSATTVAAVLVKRLSKGERGVHGVLVVPVEIAGGGTRGTVLLGPRDARFCTV
jgi:hypothetical protein